MEDTRSEAAGAYAPPVANAVSRYYVKIDKVPSAVFSEVSGLQMETELFDYQEGGNNGFIYRLPTVTKAGNVTLKRGIVRDNDLFLWYQRIASGIMDLREVTITLYATQHAKNGLDPVVTWVLTRAFPCKWSGAQLSAGTDTVAIETVEIAHSGVIAVQ